MENPSLINIKKRRTKRLSPYSENEIWEREELLSIVCSLVNGSPIQPEAMWTMMKQLRERIIHMLESGSIADENERQKLEYLLRTKKWNPYCIRHSAITSDSDYLSGYGLNKKVRWSMNSKQPSRYIKPRMGNDLKKQILVHDGIISENELQKKATVLSCFRCKYVNTTDVKFCSKCSYPLTSQAYDEIKEAENRNIQTLQQKYEQDMNAMREQMNQIMSMIQQNPKLAKVKPEALATKEIER